MTQKILIVDDDLDSLKLIGLLLQRQGYQVVAASGGQQGLAQVETEEPDLILLDIMMPDMDGYEVCRRLRSDPQLAHIPVILFTAKTRVDDKVAGFEAGADDYITKPTHPAELASRVKSLLTRSTAVGQVGIAKPRGKAIAVLGIQGGVGVTTLVVNLGATFAQGGHDLILADLEHGMGAIGMQLGYSHEDGLSKLFKLRLGELVKERVAEELVDYMPGMRLLLATYSPTEAAALVPVDHTRRIMNLLAQSAELVVFDLGNRVGDSLLLSLKLADQILVCMPPHRGAVARVQALQGHLKRVGLRQGLISVVLLSTSPSSYPVDAAAINAQLQLPVLGHITAVPERAHVAVEYSKPMVLLEPESPTADQFRELAENLLASIEQRRKATSST